MTVSGTVPRSSRLYRDERAGGAYVQRKAGVFSGVVKPARAKSAAL